ncbi:hypothetical protein FNU76_00960 [Chitinimonas arctica]|uniref:Uncharacterized protein n=1 Tax=Chitinimonas arctica TaxID=2594795 RepID=A0A516SA61_9NEIS|nr:hypothetical protein [Chitinimonas arctica]QDQ25032.1 hypothetical protein FNU76_00960 [Chitinimonas arctica]
MTYEGCQIVEPEAIDKWVSSARNVEFVVALLNWLVTQLRVEFKDKYPLMRLEVIKVKYVSIYPSIGVWYGDETTADVTEEIDALTRKLIAERPLCEFMDFAMIGKTAWSEISDNLLSDK